MIFCILYHYLFGVQVISKSDNANGLTRSQYFATFIRTAVPFSPFAVALSVIVPALFPLLTVTSSSPFQAFQLRDVNGVVSVMSALPMACMVPAPFMENDMRLLALGTGRPCLSTTSTLTKERS